MTTVSNLLPADETPRATEAAAGREPDATPLHTPELEALRGMVDSLPSPILIVNPDRRVFASNLAWRRQQPAGAPPAEGRPYAAVAAECTDAATAGRLAALVDQAFEGGTPEPVAVRCEHESGPKWWQVSMRLATRGGFVTVAHEDVTALLHAEHERRAQQAVLERAQAIARTGHWEFSTETGFFRASAQALEIIGLPEDTSPSTEALIALVPEDEREGVRAAIRAARDGQPGEPVRHRIARPDGTVRWVDHSFDLRPGASSDSPAVMGVMQDVTDQVMALEALRESEGRQREALRIARASIWTWDRRTRYLTQSHDLYQRLGYESSPEAFDGRVALRHPDDREPSRRTAEDAIRRREPYAVRYRLARAEGGWAWIEERGAPLFDTNGGLTGYRGTTQDVDEQVRREEALRESGGRQREALRIARAAIWTWDTRTGRVEQSADFYRRFGYDSTPTTYEEHLALRHSDDRERTRREAGAAIEAQHAYTVRYRLARKDGGYTWIEARGVPQFDADGNLTGYRGTSQDVDEQVKREGELHEALKIARAGFWYRGREDTAPWWSPELYEMIGLDPATAPSDDNWVRHPDDNVRVAARLREAMHAREPFTTRYRVHHYVTGAWIWVELSGVPAHSAGGEVVGYRGIVRDISEEVAREAGLRHSEALLAQAQRLTRVGSSATDLETGNQRWSDEQFRLLGYQPGEVAPAAEAFYARVHEGDRQVVSAAIRALIETGEPMVGEYRVVLPDGTVRHLSSASELRRDAGGRPTEIVGATQDVTERLAAEARVRHSEARLRGVLDSVGDGITLLTRDGRNDWSNAAFQRLVGYTAEELAQQGVSRVFDEDATRDAANWWRSAGRGVDSRLPRSYRLRLRRKDGTYVFAESTPSVLRDGDEVVGMLSVIRDTTERDRLQARVDAATLEVEQILQTAALPIIVIEEDGTVRLANRRTFDMFGWTPEELVGQDVSILAAGLNPTSHREYVRHYQETEAASEPHGPMLGRTIEVVARRRDGSEFPAEVSVTEMSGPDGRRRYLGMLTDLTERKRAEAELTRMQKAEALGTLVAGVSHDFNNLLTAMVGGIAMAKAQPGEARWLDLAQEAADRATRLVQQLLQFSRRSRPEFQQVDPASLVERTTALVRETFDRRIDVSLELPTVWGVLAGDEGQLQQVVMNLLVNARDAVLERAEREGADFAPAVRVVLREDRLRGGRAVCIEVRDNGAGMTAAVRARAFDPFFTTKPVGQGTGLGLATVAGIVGRHEGEVTIDSTPGSGTTMAVRLPLLEAGAAPAAPGGATAAPAAPAAAVTRTAMVIDDEDIVRAVTTGYLEAAHYRVIPMSDGNAAIRLLEAGADVDVVLTDINMPSPNGWDILARLRGRPGIPPIVVASGYADEATALGRGAAAFLHKPFSQAVLTQTLEEVLGRE